MADKMNATCAICGKKYHMCLSCKDQMSLSPWKLHTDTAEHFKVYQVIHGYSTGVYNKSEAKDKLNRIDLSDLDSLRDNIQKIIKDIMGEVEPVVKQEPVPKTKAAKKVEPVEEIVEEAEVSEEQEVIAEVEKPVKQNKFMRNNSVK